MLYYILGLLTGIAITFILVCCIIEGKESEAEENETKKKHNNR